MKRDRSELELRMISVVGWLIMQVIGRTCRIRTQGYERAREIMLSDQGVIMALWHGRTLLPVFLCRGMGVWAITSLSRDGEIQTRIVSRFGYQIIRGSTGRGAIKAALIAAKKLEAGGVLAITPDGPKGPYHEVQEGTVFLAQKAKCPIIPVGVGIRPRRILAAWDKYAMPLPFAKAAVIFGEPITITADCVEPSSIVKKALNDVQSQAEQMVKEGS